MISTEQRAEGTRALLAQRIPRVAKRLYEIQEALYRTARDGGHIAEPALGFAFAMGRDFERLIALYRRCIRTFADPSDEALTGDVGAEYEAVQSILVSVVSDVCREAARWFDGDQTLLALAEGGPAALERAFGPGQDPAVVPSFLTDVKRALQSLRPAVTDPDSATEAGFGRVEMMMDDEERWLAAYGAY